MRIAQRRPRLQERKLSCAHISRLAVRADPGVHELVHGERARQIGSVLTDDTRGGVSTVNVL